MSGAWHGGKGSGRRNMSITQDEYDNRWDNIFGRNKKNENDNTGTTKDEFYDVLSTEDALLDEPQHITTTVDHSLILNK